MTKHTMHNALGMAAHIHTEMETMVVVVEMRAVAKVVELTIVIIWE